MEFVDKKKFSTILGGSGPMDRRSSTEHLRESFARTAITP